MIYTLSSPSRTLIPQLDPQTDMLIQLLARVIVADGHICASEIDALVHGSHKLNLKDKMGASLTEVDIREWFAAHQLILNADTSSLRPEVALTHLILKLSDWPDKQAVVDVLTEISVADADFHLKEKLLISIVRAFWQFEGLDAPDSKIET